MFNKAELAGGHHQDERFRLLIESIEDYAIYMLDTGGHVVTWNRGAELNKGYSSWEVLGKHFRMFFTPEDLAANLPETYLAEAAAQGRCAGEGWRLRKNGERFWASYVIAAIHDASDELSGFSKITRDLSERKQREDAMQAMDAALRAERDSLSAAAESSLDSLYICDTLRDGGGEIEDFVFTYLNSNVEKMTGVPRSAMLGGRMCAMFPSSRSEGLFEMYKQVVLTGVPQTREALSEAAEAKQRWIRVQAVKLRDGVAITASDVTEYRRVSAELVEQHELLRVTLRSIGDAVLTADASGDVTWLNPVAERMTGWANEEAIGQRMEHIFRIIHEETRETASNPLATCLATREIAWLAPKTTLLSRDGSEYGIEDSAAPILDDLGGLRGAVLVFHDVTEQRRLSGEINHRAAHDALTGLVNRAEFELRLRRTLLRAQTDKSQNALLYIDLDQFKVMNDSCGHSVGDQMLRQISRLLSQVVRASDTLARLGGDEFAVILNHCPMANALRLAEQICQSLDEFRFSHEGQRFRVGASVGLVSVDESWADVAQILQAADTSCYAAKEEGRNRVHTWFDDDRAMRERHGEMQWVARIEQALDEGRFVLFAQRFQSLTDAAPNSTHVEVLVRMVDLDGAVIPPGAFLPAAERFHLASRIDRSVLTQSLDWMRTAPSAELVGCLNINLSGQSVGDRTFHAWAIKELSAAGEATCRKVCIEITETAAVTHLDDAAFFIRQLHSIGVRVALDDFGAGASSFGYLKSMPVDFLKIDGQFIRDVITDPFDEAAVRCFIDVAKVAGLRTVAEFVDNPAVLERLCGMGVDFAQGYLIHKPSPINDVLLSPLADSLTRTVTAVDLTTADRS